MMMGSLCGVCVGEECELISFFLEGSFRLQGRNELKARVQLEEGSGSLGEG